MSRQTQSRHSAFEPSYFSRPSRGMSNMSSFERRFVPGATQSYSKSADILPFVRTSIESETTGLQSEQDQRREICNGSVGETA